MQKHPTVRELTMQLRAAEHAHHVAETERLALAAELKRVRGELYREQTLRRLPHLDPVITLVSGATAEEFAASADALDAAIKAARSPRKR